MFRRLRQTEPIYYELKRCKDPGNNYDAFKTPALHGKPSECGGKKLQYYSLWNSYLNLSLTSKLHP